MSAKFGVRPGPRPPRVTVPHLTPIHGMSAVRAVAPLPAPAPAPPPIQQPSGAPLPAPRAVRRPTWTVIAVAPTVSAGVRRFELRRLYVRVAVVAFCLLAVGTFAGGHALGEYGNDERLESAYGMLSEADLTTAALGDTLRALRIAAALSPAAGTAAATANPAAGTRAAPRTARLVLPVNGRITSRFARARRHPILGIWRSHDGIDIGAPSGTPIRTPAGGRVMRVERQLGYGLVVEVSHGRGVRTWYAHLRSARVKTGDRVAAGAVIATVGSSGLASGPHLHYEVRVKGKRVDPARHAFPVE